MNFGEAIGLIHDEMRQGPALSIIEPLRAKQRSGRRQTEVSGYFAVLSITIHVGSQLPTANPVPARQARTRPTVWRWFECRIIFRPTLAEPDGQFTCILRFQNMMQGLMAQDEAEPTRFERVRQEMIGR